MSFLAFLILLVAAASAWLPLVATRHWHGAWRAAALAPLLIGLLLLVAMLAERAAAPSGPMRWQLAAFAWAMGTMVYMVAALTIKSILDKSKGRSQRR